MFHVPFSCRSPSFVTFQARQWLLPREANSSHVFLTFILSNGPICLSKCVCCVLFPAWFVPMPSLQWAPLSPGVRAQASRYLYRLNSWGPPSQSSEGWAEELSWKLQVKPSVGNISFCSLHFLTLLTPSTPFVFLPCVSTVASSGQACWTTIIFSSSVALSYLSACCFLCFIPSVTVAFHQFLFSETISSQLPIKELAIFDPARKVDFSLQPCLNTFCLFVAPDKADLLLQNWAFCESVLLALYCES